MNDHLDKDQNEHRHCPSIRGSERRVLRSAPWHRCRSVGRVIAPLDLEAAVIIADRERDSTHGLRQVELALEQAPLVENARKFACS